MDISDSYGLCKGSTCSSVPTRDIVKNDQRSSYSPDVINAICDIYIGNYLKSTGREPSDRSVHYNRTIENARKACLMDVEAEGSAHVGIDDDETHEKKMSCFVDSSRKCGGNLCGRTSE